MSSSYREVYDRCKLDPVGFLKTAAADIDWFSPPIEIYRGDINLDGRRFADGVFNTCHNAVDRHVAGGRGDLAAIIYDSAVTGTKRSISYAELLREVQTCAPMLEDLGVKRGDRVLLFVPMVPEALFVICSPARIGGRAGPIGAQETRRLHDQSNRMDDGQHFIEARSVAPTSTAQVRPSDREASRRFDQVPL